MIHRIQPLFAAREQSCRFHEIEIPEVIELSKYFPDAAAPIPRILSIPQALDEITKNLTRVNYKTMTENPLYFNFSQKMSFGL